jgi:hypothetical protein
MKRDGDAPSVAAGIAGGGGSGGGADTGDDDPLAMVRASPKFEEIKAQLQADPSSAMSVVTGLMGTDPELATAIMENREAFKEMMVAEAARAKL